MVTSIADFHNISSTDQVDRNKSIFIWLDILGWSEALEDDGEYSKLLELLQKFQSLFNESDYYEAVTISDGIALRIKKMDFVFFKKAINDIGEKQFEFVKSTAHFIRGGIAVGTFWGNIVNPDKFSDSNHMFVSNGLARAVKLESNHVSWPIIGTDDKNLKELRTLFEVRNDSENFGLSSSLNSKGERVYFIDFITEDLEEYYKILIEKYNAFRAPEYAAILSKYVWLMRQYHHKFNADYLPQELQEVVL